MTESRESWGAGPSPGLGALCASCPPLLLPTPQAPSEDLRGRRRPAGPSPCTPGLGQPPSQGRVYSRVGLPRPVPPLLPSSGGCLAADSGGGGNGGGGGVIRSGTWGRTGLVSRRPGGGARALTWAARPGWGHPALAWSPRWGWEREVCGGEGRYPWRLCPPCLSTPGARTPTPTG